MSPLGFWFFFCYFSRLFFAFLLCPGPTRDSFFILRLAPAIPWGNTKFPPPPLWGGGLCWSPNSGFGFSPVFFLGPNSHMSSCLNFIGQFLVFGTGFFFQKTLGRMDFSLAFSPPFPSSGVFFWGTHTPMALGPWAVGLLFVDAFFFLGVRAFLGPLSGLCEVYRFFFVMWKGDFQGHHCGFFVPLDVFSFPVY